MKKHIELFKEYFRKEILSVIALSLIIVIGTTVRGAVPYVFGKMIDSLAQLDLDKVIFYLFINLIITVITIVISFVESYLGNYIVLTITNEFKAKIFKQVIYLRNSVLDKYTRGELLNRIEGDVGTIVSTYLDMITSIIQVIFNFVISLYFIFTISTTLSVFAMLFIPITYWINIAFKKKYKEYLTKQKHFNDMYYGFLNERLYNLSGVKAFGLEQNSCKKVDVLYRENERLSKNGWILNGQLTSLRSLVDSLFSFGILYIASRLIVVGELSIGSLVSFNEYISRLFQAITKIMSLNMDFNNISISIERIDEIIMADSEIGDLGVLTTDTFLNERIRQFEVRDIIFSYGEQQIIKKMSIEINQNGFYALVGVNGSGKSTLIKLLMRFYECEQGAIYYNEKDIKTIPLSILRSQVTYIAKELFIFNDTILNNITLDDDSRSIEELKEICNQVGLSEYIEKLPQSYNTVIGEGGLILSSGLKQRLAVARALYRNSSLLLLDEVTSDLDGSAEQDIISLLKTIAKDKIIILISHKSSSIRCCDKIFLINNGRVGQCGSHYELLEKSSLYKEMFWE